MYKIISVHAEYNTKKQLSLLAVLWYSNEDMNWVRASYCTLEPIGGYNFLFPNEQLNNDLIQKVAGSGMNLPDNLKRKYFPGKKLWER